MKSRKIEHSRESLVATLFQYSGTIAEYFISREWNLQWIMIELNF